MPKRAVTVVVYGDCQNMYSIFVILPRQYGSGPSWPTHATSQNNGMRMPERSPGSEHAITHGCTTYEPLVSLKRSPLIRTTLRRRCSPP
jgi:hypothetical protein